MTVNKFYQLTRADFLQRVRGNTFFVMVVLTILLSYLFVPPLTANYTTVIIDSYRLLYNSAGIGLMFGIMISLFLSLFTFYMVKNSVERDRSTRVGLIIATTPTSTVTYLLGKWGSNLLLLTLLIAIMTLMAPIMQWLRGESTVIQLWQLVVPLWLVGLPVMSLVAGTAVLFETIPFLRGSVGNIAYFFLWIFLLLTVGMTTFEHDGYIPEPFGISQPVNQIVAQVGDTNPNFQPELTMLGDANSANLTVLDWTMNAWSGTAVAFRILWLLAGAGLAALGALPFDRFNPANARSHQPNRLERWWQRQVEQRRKTAVASHPAPTKLTPLTQGRTAFRFGALLLAELKLTLKGQPWWWYLGALGFIIFGLTQPIADNTLAVLIAMIWPVLIWSALGTREKQYHTAALIWTTPRAVWRQLPAAWLGGVGVSFVVLSGFALQLLFIGAWLPLLGMLTSALFVPALALALGVLSGTNRLFEIVYLTWWYIVLNLGNENAMLNFMPLANPQAIFVYLAATGLLLGVAIVGRLARV